MFKGLGNLGNIAGMVSKLQELPDRMQQLNDQMKSERVSASSGCGHVTVTMNGVGEVQDTQIDPVVYTANDGGPVPVETLQSAITEATNAAGAQAKQLYASAISQLASDMDINMPGIDGLLSSFGGGG